MLRMGGEEICIFDLDGTLADDGGRNHYLHPRHPELCSKAYGVNGVCECGAKRDWNRYFAEAGNDLPKSNTIKVCNDLARWHKIYILSGRSESTREVTRKWLHDQGVVYDKLIMRGIDDRTQDDELKLRWVEELGIKERVLCIFEDRQRVVDAWRRAGYTCFQVAPGNF